MKRTPGMAIDIRLKTASRLCSCIPIKTWINANRISQFSSLKELYSNHLKPRNHTIRAVSHKHVCVLWVDWSWQRCSRAVYRWISLCAAGHSSHTDTAALSGLTLELVWQQWGGGFSNHVLSVNLHLWTESGIFEMLISCKVNRQLRVPPVFRCWVFRVYILLRW